MSKNHKRGNKGKDVDVEVFKEFPIAHGECRKDVLAYTVCVNGLFFNGDASGLIPHLKNDHGMSFEQIKIGIEEMRKEVGPCFDGWEKFY